MIIHFWFFMSMYNYVLTVLKLENMIGSKNVNDN